LEGSAVPGYFNSQSGLPTGGIMPRTSTDVPKSKSDAEETDWYRTPQGRLQTQREFARALKDGTLIRSSGSKIAKTDPKVLEDLMEQAKQNATRVISIRVPIADLEQAQRIAEKTGVGYQTVLKQAIREGLKRAG
jgi:capsular polysaccharide biosynthesis protein